MPAAFRLKKEKGFLTTYPPCRATQAPGESHNQLIIRNQMAHPTELAQALVVGSFRSPGLRSLKFIY